MSKLKILVPLTLLMAGCAGHPIEPNHRDLTGRERQCLNRVEALMYDTTPRTPSPGVEVYDDTKPITRPGRQIAFLTCEGAAHEEVDMTKGIMEKARLLGADAIIMLNPNTGGDIHAGHGGSRAVWRAKAVVYTSGK